MVDRLPETETSILDGALAEVREHGIRRTSISEIARRSGVSRQTLYRYWPDAQSLFAALVTRELGAVLNDLPDRMQTLEELIGMLAETAARIRAMPLVDRLRDTDPELFARYILDRLGTSQRAIIARVAGAVSAGQSIGIVRPGDPERLAAMVLVIAQSAVQSAPLFREWLDDEHWRVELHTALRGYLRVEQT